MTRYLSVANLVEIARMLGCQEVRDLGLLDSAAHRPAASAFGEDAYPDLHTKAAALLESIVRNDPLIDGNKRLGFTATVVFYRLNGQVLDVADDPAEELVVAVAEGGLDLPRIAATLSGWVRPV